MDTDRIDVVHKNTITEKWLCIGCKFLIGYVENKKFIRIKRKDLYVNVELGKEGTVEVPCPRCGKVNELHDDGLSENN